MLSKKDKSRINYPTICCARVYPALAVAGQKEKAAGVSRGCLIILSIISIAILGLFVSACKCGA
jgi:hypothetical protein